MGKYISNTDFKRRVYDLVKNEYAFLENYKGALIKILCKHNTDFNRIEDILLEKLKLRGV